MTLFGEFYVPAKSFALYETLQALPDLVIEVERAAATDEIITPYFSIAGCRPEEFERAAERDSSVAELQKIDSLKGQALYRADWVVNVESIIYAYTAIGSTILEASAQYDSWELRMRFSDEESLDRFSEYCFERGIPFELTKLYHQANPRSEGRYGLTPKQHKALVMAWEMDYFTSSKVTLVDVAEQLDISAQALSKRLSRAHDSLIEHTLMVTPPGGSDDG
ncbi:bacterio-opsin activator domain-containing protein [Natronococcus sp. A-GB1]|uniref:bacterio-opsin activator domain-containing protein n=1 Tax=Natronococcus sp. A-GB1 TaxID=3037648 RepID=UPI00241D0159|nr:bacterio-opsin activator domain-containing protein [Natronococcus sp. A-GB1]MDG5758196.1 bacterio-opsin activator domain-containing protein [Natronococcus sp. A-GB1]